MALSVPSTAGFITVDTSSPKTVQLPLTSQRLGRILTIKDRIGLAQTNPITIQTQGGDTFQDGATTYRITVPFGAATFVSRSGQWLLQIGTQDIQASTIKGDGSGLTNLPLASTLQSTIAGLGTSGYISSFSLISTVSGLGSATYVSSPSLASTTLGLQNYVSSAIQNQPYSYAGTTLYMNYSVDVPPYKQLGNDIVFISSQVLRTSLTGATNDIPIIGFQSDFGLPSFIPRGLWNFTVFSQASAADIYMYPELYIRSTTGTEYLVATNKERPTGVLTTVFEWLDDLIVPSTINLNGGQSIVVKLLANNSNAATRSLSNFFQDGTYSHVHTTFGTIFPDTVLQSTVGGLGAAGYVSTLTLFSTSAGLFNYTNNFIDLPELRSSITGLGSASYISSPSLFSTVASLQNQISASGFLSTPNLTSTVTGLGSAGYASTSFVGNAISTFSSALGSPLFFPSLQSTVQGLGSASYVSTATLFSTTTGIYNFVSTFIDPAELTSTIVGLGSASFVSSLGLQARLQSTVEGLGSASYISSQSLTSTVIGLGSSRYISTQISSFLTLSTGNLTTSTLTYLDAANNNAPNLTYVSSTYFFYNNYIVAGTFQLQPQFISF